MHLDSDIEEQSDVEDTVKDAPKRMRSRKIAKTKQRRGTGKTRATNVPVTHASSSRITISPTSPVASRSSATIQRSSPVMAKPVPNQPLTQIVSLAEGTSKEAKGKQRATQPETPSFHTVMLMRRQPTYITLTDHTPANLDDHFVQEARGRILDAIQLTELDREANADRRILRKVLGQQIRQLELIRDNNDDAIRQTIANNAYGRERERLSRWCDKTDIISEPLAAELFVGLLNDPDLQTAPLTDSEAEEEEVESVEEPAPKKPSISSRLTIGGFERGDRPAAQTVEPQSLRTSTTTPTNTTRHSEQRTSPAGEPTVAASPKTPVSNLTAARTTPIQTPAPRSAPVDTASIGPLGSNPTTPTPAPATQPRLRGIVTRNRRQHPFLAGVFEENSGYVTSSGRPIPAEEMDSRREQYLAWRRQQVAPSPQPTGETTPAPRKTIFPPYWEHRKPHGMVPGVFELNGHEYDASGQPISSQDMIDLLRQHLGRRMGQPTSDNISAPTASTSESAPTAIPPAPPGFVYNAATNRYDPENQSA